MENGEWKVGIEDCILANRSLSFLRELTATAVIFACVSCSSLSRVRVTHLATLCLLKKLPFLLVAAFFWHLIFSSACHAAPEDYEYGRFAWITDPEGNRIELWEPYDKA